METRGLLYVGLLTPLLYAAGDAIAGVSWVDYSFRDHTISELGAVGAPTRAVFTVLVTAAWACLIALGVGVRRAAGARRPLRVAGTLLLAVGLMAVTVGQFVPMRPRGTAQGLTGLLHLVEAGLAMTLVLTAMVLSARALGPRFRVYTLASIATMVAFGAWSGMQAGAVEAGLPTPYLGITERVFWYTYMTWFAGLGAWLLREGAGERRAERAGV